MANHYSPFTRLRLVGVATTALCLWGGLSSAFAQQGHNPAPDPASQTRAPAEPAVSTYPAPAAGDGLTTSGYNLSRWAEDWTKMRDAKNRRDFLDRLKFIPLNKKQNIYLTFSGEMRLRLNQTSNPNLKKGPAQRQDIMRLVGGADLHITRYFRAFGELAHGGVSGPNIGVPAASMRNKLLLQQYFAEADAPLPNLNAGVRYGRQEFTDGANLMTSQRDNNTLRFVLNGTRFWLRGKKLRGDFFDFHYTLLGRGGARDDVIDRGIRFSGGTAGIVIPTSFMGKSKLFLDPFVWRLRNRRAVWGSGPAREDRLYYGMRLWGDVDRLTVDWVANYQGGHYDGRRIEAFQVFLAQTYRLGSSRTAPRIGLHGDYASGGGAFGKGTLRNALAPFGNNIYYSYQLFLTPTNLIALAPNITVSPIESLRLTVEHQFAWRASLTDAVYRANGTAFSGTQKTHARRVAQATRVQGVWTWTPRLSFTGRYEHLQAGPALTRAGYTSSDFVAGWANYRF
ncbi:alginate export family protein [Asaia spathodeae]|uniref:Alginate export family protein n=1 Tax=Asaia spathodeae TaxID=657016 RepID=A0ABX2P525_9PROT|nr:alginate export family protein [Asaia spathodeae]